MVPPTTLKTLKKGIEMSEDCKEELLENEGWEDCLCDGGEEDDGGDDNDTGGDDNTDAGGDAGNKGEDEKIPVSALKAVRDENRSLKDKINYLMGTIDNIRSGTTAKSKDDEDDSGNDADLITKGDLKKILNSTLGPVDAMLTEVQFKASHSDYDELITNYLPEILDRRPDLRQILLNTPKQHRPQLAYEIVKHSPSYTEKVASKKKDEVVDKIMKNASKPGSVNAVGGKGGTTDKVSSILTMSKDDFEAHMNKVKARQT